MHYKKMQKCITHRYVWVYKKINLIAKKLSLFVSIIPTDLFKPLTIGPQ